MPHVYVTGHKNPDTDTIASAIGYAEYKNLVDPENHYVAARLGEVNAQTRWALEKSGAEEPGLLEHIMLRVKDVMAGEGVRHRKFGFGEVVEAGVGRFVIRFGTEERTFVPEIAPLSKV